LDKYRLERELRELLKKAEDLEEMANKEGFEEIEDLLIDYSAPLIELKVKRLLAEYFAVPLPTSLNREVKEAENFQEKPMRD